jgi:hypothetical protein
MSVPLKIDVLLEQIDKTTVLMSVRDTADDVAAAYDPAAVAASDRLLSAVEAPLAVTTLLAGLSRKPEGGPLSVLVRLEPNNFVV